MPSAWFTRDMFQFFVDLRLHNDREWFAEHRTFYDEEIVPRLQRFVTAMAPKLKKIAPSFVAEPKLVGGSIFRIHRDVRFSKDKTPYKPHASMRFFHRDAREVTAPVFYLHLEPRNVFLGAGVYHPEPDALRTIRQALARDGRPFVRAVAASKMSLGGESLRRVPQGFDPEHPLAEHLRRKDFVLMRALTDAQATRADFLDVVAESYRAAAPLVRYLCGALELSM